MKKLSLNMHCSSYVKLGLPQSVTVQAALEEWQLELWEFHLLFTSCINKNQYFVKYTNTQSV